ncbi:MAG: hypothetical protein NTX22_15905 [Ignavibacteriales bacterium]|nr:hypothetical protein [Ignavibacteriales bacterium]
MEGLQYLIDENGKKKAVLLDLDVYADKWEDIYDILVSYSRKNEKKVRWEDLKHEVFGAKQKAN